MKKIPLPVVGLCLWCSVIAGAQPRESGQKLPVLLKRIPPVRTVQPREYQAAVLRLKRAIAVADEAKQQLAGMAPSDKKPDLMDCYFHPWHPGCETVMNPMLLKAAEKATGTPRPPVTRPPDTQAFVWGIVRWAGGAYAWDVAKCLYKADVGGQGLETEVGLEKIGNCLLLKE